MLVQLPDLLDRHSRFAVAGDIDHVITELGGIELWHDAVFPGRPSGKPDQMSPHRAADPRGRQRARLWSAERADISPGDSRSATDLREADKRIRLLEQENEDLRRAAV